MINIIDAAIGLDGNDAVLHGIQGRQRTRPVRDAHVGRRLGQHLHRGEQQCRPPFALDQNARELDARDLPVRARELYFVTIGGGLAGQAPVRITLDQLSIICDDEVGQPFADDVLRARAQHVEEAGVRKQYCLAMNQHSLMHRLYQALEQLVTVARGAAAPAQRLEQRIDRRAQFNKGLRLGFDRQRPRCAGLAGDLQDLPGHLIDSAILPALADIEDNAADDQQARENGPEKERRHDHREPRSG